MATVPLGVSPSDGMHHQVLSKLPIAPFNLLIVLAVVLASVAPAEGEALELLGRVSVWAVMLLFFGQGAKLSPAQLRGGIMHGRLHLAVGVSTYLFFPLLGVLLRPLGERIVGEGSYQGVLVLCSAPSTIQTSIVFVSLARGNVPAALCAASLSSLAGVIFMPLWLELFGIQTSSAQVPWKMAWELVVQLVLPIAVGQLSRRWIGEWVERRRAWLGRYDQGTIVLVVYVAFSHATAEGLWRVLSAYDLLALLALSALMLTLVLLANVGLARALRFSKEDEITLVFCGSKKGLAAGASIANVVLPSASVGLLLIPLMVFHQLQLMVAAPLSRRYAQRP